MVLFSCRDIARPPLFGDWRLDLDAGQVAVLSAPSGTGKTLLLRALADLDPASGTVQLRGIERERFEPHAWRRDVLYVHPSPPRFAGTVADNLALVRELAESRTDATPTTDALPPLDGALDAERLSSGEAQLLALHRALLLDPTVLLLDEATASLDPKRARSAEQALRSWAGSGERAILWVSHDPDLADRLDAKRVRLT